MSSSDYRPEHGYWPMLPDCDASCAVSLAVGDHWCRPTARRAWSYISYGMIAVPNLSTDKGWTMWPEDCPQVAITVFCPGAAFVVPSLLPVLDNNLNTERGEVGSAAIVQGF